MLHVKRYFSNIRNEAKLYNSMHFLWIKKDELLKGH